MKRTTTALLLAFALGGAHAIAQEEREVSKPKQAPGSAYVLGISGMT